MICLKIKLSRNIRPIHNVSEFDEDQTKLFEKEQIHCSFYLLAYALKLCFLIGPGCSYISIFNIKTGVLNPSFNWEI